MSAHKFITKCQKYDNGKHTVETCLPKTMSNIKKLFQLLLDCEDDNECDVQSPGFERSFLMAIIEADVALDSDINDYLTNVLHLPIEIHQNPVTHFLETNSKKRAQSILDKEFAEYYQNYLNVMEEIDQLLLLKDREVKDIPISKLREILEKYLEVVIAFCVYINSNDDIKKHFQLGCKNLKSLKKIKTK
jgi:hypothetical protein